jgi:hypothetical protein
MSAAYDRVCSLPLFPWCVCVQLSRAARRVVQEGRRRCSTSSSPIAAGAVPHPHPSRQAPCLILIHRGRRHAIQGPARQAAPRHRDRAGPQHSPMPPLPAAQPAACRAARARPAGPSDACTRPGASVARPGPLSGWGAGPEGLLPREGPQRGLRRRPQAPGPIPTSLFSAGVQQNARPHAVNTSPCDTLSPCGTRAPLQHRRPPAARTFPSPGVHGVTSHAVAAAACRTTGP